MSSATARAASGPVRLLEIELAEPIPDVVAATSASGSPYTRGLVLVRLHGEVLGTVELSLRSGGMLAADLGQRIWDVLAKHVTEHMRSDGLTVPVRIGPTGLPVGDPRCTRDRKQMLAGAPFVSIAVPTRDRPESMATCLRGLLALDYPRYEIIVVDNAPRTRETADLVASFSESPVQVRYVREDRPGISWAKNRGCWEARGEIVAFTDDDVLVDRYWLSALVRGFRAGARVACVTGLIFPMELETPPQIWIEQFGGFSKGFQRRLFDLKGNRPRDALYPYTAGMFGSGANMALDVAVMRKLGGFDPALGAGAPAVGGEDLAMYFDLILAGYQIAYEPSALIRHAHRRDYEGLKRQVRGYGVGLSAFLTKTVVDHPSSILRLAAKLPLGLAYALLPSSAKNRKKSTEYPKELTFLELLGMLLGPVSYLRSRRRVRAMGRLVNPPSEVLPTAANASADTALCSPYDTGAKGAS